MCLIKLVCLIGMSILGSSLKRWYEIPNHDEEMFFNWEDEVDNIEEAIEVCSNLSAINLVLWKLPVIEYFVNLSVNYGFGQIEGTFL